MFETWLDVAVYAPLGLLLKIRKELPELVDTGRQTAENRVQVARMIGQMAVAYGRTELNRRIAASRPAPAPAGGRSVPLDTTAVEVDDDVAPPFEGYDTLPASQIVARLSRMGMSELAAVAAYESAHRGRRTILAKAEQLSSRS